MSSGVDRTKEYERWSQLACASVVNRSTDSGNSNDIGGGTTIDRKAIIERYGDDNHFYQVIEEIEKTFTVLTSIYPLDHDHNRFQKVARELKDMLKMAALNVSEHSFTEDQRGLSSSNMIWGQIQGLFDRSKSSTANVGNSLNMIRNHRKSIIETLQNQLLSYLQSVDEVRKNGLEYCTQSYFKKDHTTADRRKRLGDLLKNTYDVLQDSEDARKIVLNRGSQHTSDMIRRDSTISSSVPLLFPPFKEVVEGSLKDRSRRLAELLNEPYEDRIDPEFLQALLPRKERQQDSTGVINITASCDIDTESPEAGYVEDNNITEKLHNNGALTDNIDNTKNLLRESKDNVSNDQLQLDDLIVADQPLLQYAQQSLTDVSAMLNVFVEQITHQADQAVDLLQTTEASKELIYDSIFQLKQAVNRTENKQLLYVALFTFMSLSLLTMDMMF